MRRHALAAPVHCVLPLLLTGVLLLAATSDGIRPAPSGVKMAHGQGTPTAALQVGRSGGDSGFLLQEAEVYATGSSLPDCSHACGACSPCNRVMVSFKCSIAEPCPMVYRCMCKGKRYPVPSS